MQQMLMTLVASGKDVKYQYIPLDVFAGMAGEETAQMFAYFDEFGCGYHGLEGDWRRADPFL
jgi:hypothetical protein